MGVGRGYPVLRPRTRARECGGAVVIEEFLDGPEVSLFALTDGETVVPLQPAQDFKRAYDAAANGVIARIAQAFESHHDAAGAAPVSTSTPAADAA